MLFDENAESQLKNDNSKEKKDKRSNKSIYKGVFRCGKKFKAQIQTNGVQHYLGIFDTEEAAAKAYDDHARTYLGINAKTNFTYSSPDSEISSGLHIQTIVSQQHQEMIKNSSETKKRAINEGNDETRKLAHPRRIYSGKKTKVLTSSNRFASSVLAIQHATPQQLSYMCDPSLLLQQSEMANALPVQHKIPSMSGAGWDSQEGFTISTRIQQPNPAISMSSIRQQLVPPSFDEMIHSNVHYEESHLQPANHSLYYPRKSDNVQPENGNSNETVNDEDGDDEVDWRLQIYYWVGQFDLDQEASSSRFCWKGCWLGSFVGRPSEEDFASSSNAFEYVTDSVSITNNIKAETAEGDIYIPSETVFHGYYMMENDSSGKLEKFLDKGIVMHFMRDEPSLLYGGDNNRDIDSNILTVVGRGDSEFGVFFLHGTWNSFTKTLDMCRQYLLDTDIRVDMDMDEYKQHLRLSGLPV